ncbi:hypothetical protein C4J96_1408 [Pseudomonas orientalis]|uniref:hypothetical protein n=1 Tax=Pseudomonas orientalis TaxID=76758 RepID=UPI000F585410|nr:hypothetical protein [Pseudomonas orientalis]AZE93541.1 hypothetical protein C4J96_1408 [Pseudomonas orientalis]
MSSNIQKSVNKSGDQEQGPMEEWEDPVPIPGYSDAPVIDGLLPAVPGDNHRDVVPRAMQEAGLVLRVLPWKRGLNDPFEVLTVLVNGRPVFIDSYDTDVPLPDPVVINIGVQSTLQENGLKDISVHVLNASDNDINYNIRRVYVDARDPNGNRQPAPIEFEDYGAELTPADLEGKPGLGFTIPEPAERRGGDKRGINVDTAGVIVDDVPLTGPITGTIPTSMILARAGTIEIGYWLSDRSGNRTVLSDPAYVRVSLNNPPVFGAISVLEAPLVNKEEARNGATVRLQNITGHLPTDFLRAVWGTVEIYNQAIGSTGGPIDILANYAAIAAGGNFYTADIQLFVDRPNSPTFPSPVVQVDVDLREPGDNQNPGPGPEDPTLARPVLLGGGPAPRPDNRISDKDRGFDATATLALPAGLTVGDFIDLIYGPNGDVASTYTVTGAEPAGFQVPFTVLWTLIDSIGNNPALPIYCKIRDAVNYKHTPTQNVVVETFNLAGLANPIFNNAQTLPSHPHAAYFINCSRSPWQGVPIKVLDPALLEVGDKVTIEAYRYAYVPASTPIGAPIGDPVKTAEFDIDSSHINLGLIVPLDLSAWFRDFTGTQGRGYVGVRWTLFRPSTGDRGHSMEVKALWDLVASGNPPTCVPGATRRSGTL